MDDEHFKQLFERIVEAYELSPEVAAELLQRILEILSQNSESENDPEQHCNSS